MSWILRRRLSVGVVFFEKIYRGGSGSYIEVLKGCIIMFMAKLNML
jgi:hypothetical protein